MSYSPTEVRNPGNRFFATSAFCVISRAVTTSIGLVKYPVRRPEHRLEIKSIAGGLNLKDGMLNCGMRSDDRGEPDDDDEDDDSFRPLCCR